MPRLVECVPNFSTGRDPIAIAAIADAIAAVAGATVLDVSSDASHNRTVVTFVATTDAAVDAAFAGIAAAAQVIDLGQHAGVHPRIGAADVVPFVPLPEWGTSMEDAVALARTLGARVGEELAIPVYLYERAATRPERENLAHVRRGNFEGLRDALAAGDPARLPDFGPPRVHPTAGACVIGARPLLVAYNVYLGGVANLAVAKQVARAVRASSGGLPAVKALGLEVDGQAQVSMNLVDVDVTPLHVAFDAVVREAAARGVDVTWSELVGLAPERAFVGAGAHHVRLRGGIAGRLLERRVREAVASPATDASTESPAASPATSPAGSLAAFLDAVAAPSATPGGGSAAALAGALGAALVDMVASLTRPRPTQPDAVTLAADMRATAARADELRARLSELVASDAEAYEFVRTAQRAEPYDEAARDAALRAAARVPLEIAEACADAAALASDVAERGTPHAVTDAATAAHLAEAACRGATYMVRVNVAALAAHTPADLAMVSDATEALRRATDAAALAAAQVDQSIG